MPGTNITLTYEVEGDPGSETTTISDCNSDASGPLEIPTTLKGYPVTSIGSNAFHYCTSLSDVTIPDSVTSIEAYAFANCTGLTAITIPGSVTSFGERAFFLCSGLTSVTIPDGVTSIGGGAFYSCRGLASITIPHSVTSIETNAFNTCSGLTSVEFLGDAPASVGADAFADVAPGAQALVLPQYAASFGDQGATWNGLLVELRAPLITDFGIKDANTFFIEFSPGGTGYKITKSSDLDFSNATDVTPLLGPATPGDNRFEFEISGPKDFFRVEPL